MDKTAEARAEGLDLVDDLRAHIFRAVRHGLKIDRWTLEAQLRASCDLLALAGHIADAEPENDQ